MDKSSKSLNHGILFPWLAKTNNFVLNFTSLTGYTQNHPRHGAGSTLNLAKELAKS